MPVSEAYTENRITESHKARRTGENYRRGKHVKGEKPFSMTVDKKPQLLQSLAGRSWNLGIGISSRRGWKSHCKSKTGMGTSSGAGHEVGGGAQKAKGGCRYKMKAGMLELLNDKDQRCSTGL